MTSLQISLAGKRVLVTAGGDGIGLEITRAFAAADARVLICDVRAECLERLAKELPEVHAASPTSHAKRMWRRCSNW
jgi:NAD(P)-dependent dehydrogenase (short-subunit alcohol dehydrogenase family)